MIKIGQTDHKGNSRSENSRSEIATLKKRASILEDNGETRPKKAFWAKKKFKT